MDSTMSRRLLRILYENNSYNTWICNEIDTDSPTPHEFVTKFTNFAKSNISALASFENTASQLLRSNDPIDISEKTLNMQTPTTYNANSFDLANISTVREIANLVIDFNDTVQNFV